MTASSLKTRIVTPCSHDILMPGTQILTQSTDRWKEAGGRAELTPGLQREAQPLPSRRQLFLNELTTVTTPQSRGLGCCGTADTETAGLGEELAAVASSVDLSSRATASDGGVAAPSSATAQPVALHKSPKGCCTPASSPIQGAQKGPSLSGRGSLQRYDQTPTWSCILFHCPTSL